MKKVIFYVVIVLTIFIGLGYAKPVFALTINTPKITNISYVNENEIKLYYYTSNANTSYRVQIKNLTTGKSYVTEVNTTSYNVKDLAFGKTYNLQMRVYYKTLAKTYVSDWSNIVSATPRAKAPTISSISAADKALTINYKVTGTPKGVQIYNYNAKNIVSTTNLTSYTYSGLTNGTKYKFIIRNYYGNSIFGPWSNPIEGTPNASATETSTSASKVSHSTITKSALALAWPYGSGKKHTWSKGKPTAAYKSALDRVYPTHNKWGKCPRKGASCDVFVGTVIRNSGYDKSFPRGLDQQFPYLKKHTKKWKHITYTGKQSQLQSGDVIAYDYKGNGAHILVYVKTPDGNGRIAEAGLCSSYGRLTKYRKIVAGGKNKWVRAYRAVDASYR